MLRGDRKYGPRPCVRNMVDAGVPRALICILMLLAYSTTVAPNVGDIDLVEVFAGTMAIVQEGERRGLLCRGIDLEMSEAMDLTTSAGLLLALVVIRRVRRGGLVVFAPVCSTFSWMNAATSGRSILMPEGLPGVPSVLIGNILATRTVLLFQLCTAMHIVAVIEQPKHFSTGGLMGLARFRALVRDFWVYRVGICMGWFGSRTLKPTHLFSNHACIRAMLQHQPPRPMHQHAGNSLVRKTIVGGKLRITGLKETLKSTQQYTLAFASALVDSWQSGCRTTDMPWLPIFSEHAAHV